MTYLGKIFKDSYGILKPTSNVLVGYPAFEYARVTALNAMHATHNNVYIKYLKCYGDGNLHTYKEIHKKIFPNEAYGKDIDCWKIIRNNKFITFDSKGRHGIQFFKITDLGRELLKIVDANQVCHKIFRWYKIDDDKRESAMIEADLNGESSYLDLEPESFIAMFDALLDDNSELSRIGSRYRFLNKVMRAYATIDDFRVKASDPKVRSWLEEKTKDADEMDSYKLFLKAITKIDKRIAKKALKNAA